MKRIIEVVAVVVVVGSGCGFCNHYQVTRSTSDDENCSQTVLEMIWSWYAYVDIIAVEWSAHGQSESNLHGMQLLLLEHKSVSSRQLLYPSFQSTVSALMPYFGNLLRRVDSIHELKEASSIFKDSPVLHTSWINNSTSDFPYGLADGVFTGPTMFNSLNSFARRGALTATSGSSNSSHAFSVVLKVVDGCPTSWEILLNRHNNLRQMDNKILPLQGNYLYNLLRDNGCINRYWAMDDVYGNYQNDGTEEEEHVEVDIVSSTMKDTHLLHNNFRVACYSCPTFSSEELLRSYTSNSKI